MEKLWPLINVIGPLILILAVVWLTLRNRKARPGEIAAAEQGARDLRRQLDEEEAERGEP